MIHDHLHQDWQRLISHTGLDTTHTEHLYFDHATLAQQAAESGLGVWLTDRMLSGPMLESGRLIPLFDTTLPARRHLFLVHNRNTALSASATAAKQWILERFTTP